MNLLRRLLCIFLLPGLTLLAAGTAGAADYAETAARIEAARKGIEAAGQAIAQAQDKLQKAIDKVMAATHFEGPHWAELDQAMKAWSDTVDKQAAVMDGHARTLLKLAPNANLPVLVPESPAFKPLLKQMEGIARDLQASIDRAEAMKRRYQQLEAQTQADIGEAAKGKIADIALDAIGVPTDAADLVATLAGGAISAVYGAAKTAWGLYYYLDEMKSAGRVVKTAQQQQAFADEFIQKTQASLASARQGIGFLERYMAQREETLARFYGVRNGWLKVQQDSAASQFREETQHFDEALAKPAPGLYLPGRWPGVDQSALLASEYEPEAESILKELRSAAAAAVDGGSPLLFHELLDGHTERLSKRIQQAQERLDRANQRYNQAYEAYSAASQTARENRWQGHRNCNTLQSYDARVACSRSVEASYEASMNAAVAPLYGPAREVADAYREWLRPRQILWIVQDGARDLVSMMLEAAQARRQGYSMLWAEHQTAMQEAAQDVSIALGQIPGPWQLRSYAATADGVQDFIAREIRWAADPAALRDHLREEVRRIRQLGDTVQQALREYRKGLEAQRNVANRAESELGGFVKRYGPLMRYYGGYPDYTQIAIDTYLEQQLTWIRQSFKVEEAEHVAEAARFDYPGTARRIEAGIAELDDWVQRLDTFRWRLGNSLAKLEPVSQAITGKPAFSPRPKPLAEQAREELRGGAWSSLVADLERLGADHDLREALRNLYRGVYGGAALEGDTPRRLLLNVQSGLYALTQDKMRNYLRARPAFFHPVAEADMKKLEKLWRDLKPLYARFEALAAGERGRLDGLYALFPDDSRLTQAYQAVPAALAHLVQGPYFRYIQEVGALRGYLDIRRDALLPVTDDLARQLQDWIEGYANFKADWERRQAEAAARQEAERQRLEAEERARREREEAERRAAEAPLNAVRRLYQDFAEAYQARNLSRLTRMMTPDWRASDGSDLRDLEDNLSNSFRVFDRVSFRLDNLSIQPQGAGRFKVNYSVTISGQIFQMDLKHQEKSDIEDVVVVGADGAARIQSTRGGRLWLQ